MVCSPFGLFIRYNIGSDFFQYFGDEPEQGDCLIRTNFDTTQIGYCQAVSNTDREIRVAGNE
jgi:hypothetical protein